MRIDEQEIREAMDRRLSSLTSSAIRRAKIRQGISQKEEKIVRKKLAMSMALALCMVFVLAGAAVAAGMNLFDYFGAKDNRLQQLAGQTVIRGGQEETVESMELGTSVAAIDNAYYDGQSLLLACSIRNSTRMERFVPTEEQLAQAEKQQPCWTDLTESESAAVVEFGTAAEAGEAVGLVRYSISLGDSTETAAGIRLHNYMEMEEITEEGDAYILREYRTPLPEEAQNQNQLNVQIDLYQEAVYFWFDGKDMYSLPVEYEEIGVLTASVQKSDAEPTLYQGEGSYNGMAVRAEAQISPVHGTITIVSDEAAFPGFKDHDSWYTVDVQDEQGRKLKVSAFDRVDEGGVRFEVNGVGETPERLTVYVYVESEGEWNREEAMQSAGIIEMTAEKAE